ncbi:MAG: tagatose 1,6-diphosphate aldolase [Candidatus Poribacteria bacterium]
MAVEISAGKLRGLTMLSDSDGRFRMMAIDQRGSLVKKLSEILNKSADQVTYNDLATVKASITKILSPYSSATLADPIFGYPYSIEYIPKNVGLLLAFEDSGYDKSGANGVERKSRPIPNWSVRKAKRAGADAVKLLLYYRPEASKETLEHQHKMAIKVGLECERYDLPFLLETVSYSMLSDELNSPSIFATRKPEIVAQTAVEFSKPEYKIDILKLEFPAELKYTVEFADGRFGDRKREPVYDLEEVKQACKKVDQASQLPWVILSAGVEIDEFIENVKLASSAGASGFLCGRAIWQDSVQYYPDMKAMEDFLTNECIENFQRVNNIVHQAIEGAKPWYTHRRFGGKSNIALKDAGEDWYAKF